MAPGAATILYSADEGVLKATNPLDVKMAATRGLFSEGYSPSSTNTMGKSLGELFGEVTKNMSKKERTILQIVRVFGTQDQEFATIWFTDVEK